MLFCFLQMLVVGTATLLCWTGGVPTKTRSCWPKCSAAVIVGAAGLTIPSLKCAPCVEQVESLIITMLFNFPFSWVLMSQHRANLSLIFNVLILEEYQRLCIQTLDSNREVVIPGRVPGSPDIPFIYPVPRPDPVPGPIPGVIPGQIPIQYPGLVPIHIPGQIPGQLPIQPPPPGITFTLCFS